MRVTVVTPLSRQHISLLQRCVESVRGQSLRASHIVVCDGFKPEESTNLHGVEILETTREARDFGDTPRAVGSAYALSAGVDVLAFLDADNWYHQRHLEWLLKNWDGSSPAVFASQRMLCEVSGRPLGRCDISGFTFVFADTSCMALAGTAVLLGLCWGEIPAYAHPIGDRYFWRSANDRVPNVLLSGRATVGYATSHAGDFERCGKMAPGYPKHSSRIRAAIGAVYAHEGIDFSIAWKASSWDALDEATRAEWNAGQHDQNCAGS